MKKPFGFHQRSQYRIGTVYLKEEYRNAAAYAPPLASWTCLSFWAMYTFE
ncbi:MAG: hypothetical protein LBD93_10015 [Treponema sp.]|nr:hypothetical protein [Treponema sp.]